MLSSLLKKGVGLDEIEHFVRYEESKLKGGGKKSNFRSMVSRMMKEKLMDNINFTLKARK